MAEFDKVIPAGQTGKVQAMLSTGKYRGKTSKSIEIFSNDPVRPRMKLLLKCTIKGIKILPSNRVYFNLPRGEIQTKTLTLATIGEADLELIARPDNPGFKIELEKISVPESPPLKPEFRSQYKIHITIPENFPSGPFSGSIALKSNSQFDSNLEILISGKVRPAVVVSPGSIRLKSENGNAPSGTVIVTRKTGDGFKIVKIITNPPGLKVIHTETKAGEQFILQIEWPGNLKQGIQQGQVILHTNDKFSPVISIPVSLQFDNKP